MISDGPIADELEVVLGAYGPPAPTLLPWLAPRISGERLAGVVLLASTQEWLAPARRWPAVTDATAGLIAARLTELDEAGLEEIAPDLPQVAAHLNGALLEQVLDHRALWPDAVCYAALTHPGVHLPEPSELDDWWPPILAAAQARPVPPLANRPLLAQLVASPPLRSSELASWEAAYLLPYLPAESSPADAAEAALAEVDDYVADDETCWYAAAVCARIAPYLDDGQRGTIVNLARAAPPAWRPLLRGLGQRHEPWPSVTAELAAAHPALPQLDELAARADPGALSEACTHIVRLIDRGFADTDGGGRVGGSADESSSSDLPGAEIFRPSDSVTRGGWLELNEPRLDVAVPVPEAPQPDRYLVGQYPATVAVGETFGLLVRITTTAAIGGAKMRPFPVPAGGTDVRIFAYPQAGLRLRSSQRVVLRVPRAGDSDSALFELQTDAPGPQRVDVVVFQGGTPLGELKAEITAERDARPGGPSRTVSAQIDNEPVDGAVTLDVHYDPTANSYRFRFIDDNFDDEVPHQLSYEPGPQVERLIAELDDFAKGRTGYSPADAVEALASTGKALWRELLPEPLREQFWARQGRIKRLTILSKQDTMPWELMYPRDRGQDEGFLVGQFPVTRWIFGRRPVRTLPLGPARFVLPSGSALPEAQSEIDAIRAILDPHQPPEEVLTAWRPVRDLANSGAYGVLHFACHNNFDPGEGSSIRFEDGLFRPKDLTDARADKTLLPSAPVVFVNACRAAGAAARYNQLDGWAQAFFEAGTAVFIGSLWAVETNRAKEIAIELYSGLKHEKKSLGEVVTAARRAAARGDGDPTWLAYTVYGDADARSVSQ